MSLARISMARVLGSFSSVSHTQISLSSRSKRIRFRCKDALLCYGGIRLLVLRWSEAAEESIYDGACVKQVFQGAQRDDLR